MRSVTSTWTQIQGVCPACGWKGSIFVGDGGYLTCSRDTCPNPCAPSEALGVKFPDYGEKVPSRPVETTGADPGPELRPCDPEAARALEEASYDGWTRDQLVEEILTLTSERDFAYAHVDSWKALLEQADTKVVERDATIALLYVRVDRFATLSSQDQDHAVKAITERNVALRTISERDATIEALTHGPFIWIARDRQGGEPCIGGTRIPVGTLTGYADALGDEAALASYPDTTTADLEEARWFMGHPHDDPRPDRCQGCDDDNCNAIQAADDRRSL